MQTAARRRGARGQSQGNRAKQSALPSTEFLICVICVICGFLCPFDRAPIVMRHVRNVRCSHQKEEYPQITQIKEALALSMSLVREASLIVSDASAFTRLPWEQGPLVGEAIQFQLTMP
jgi:hypothetical protein